MCLCQGLYVWISSISDPPEGHCVIHTLGWSLRNLEGFFQPSAFSSSFSSCLRSQLWLNETLIPQIHLVYTKPCLVTFNSVSGSRSRHRGWRLNAVCVRRHFYMHYNSILSASLPKFPVRMIPGLFNKNFLGLFLLQSIICSISVNKTV